MRASRAGETCLKLPSIDIGSSPPIIGPSGRRTFQGLAVPSHTGLSPIRTNELDDRSVGGPCVGREEVDQSRTRATSLELFLKLVGDRFEGAFCVAARQDAERVREEKIPYAEDLPLHDVAELVEMRGLVGLLHVGEVHVPEG